jgi:thiamine transport system permease protein
LSRKISLPLLYVAAYVVVVVLVPLILLFFYSLHASLSPLFLKILAASVEQSFLQGSISTVLSLGIGLFFGMLLILYDGKFKSIILSLLLITYVMPGIIMGLGIISIFGYSSRLWEIIYGNVVYNSPMIAVLAYSTGTSTNLGEIYSARVLGAGDSQVLWKFYFRNSLRGGLLGGILTFILSFEGFSLPLIIGGPSYSTMEVIIYEFKNIVPTFTQFPFSNASLPGILQVLILMVPLYIYLSIRGNSRRNDSGLPLPLKRYSSFALTGLLLFLAFVLTPLFAVFLKYPIWMINLPEIVRRLQLPFSSLLGNTLIFSFVSTFVAFMLSIIITVYRPSTRNQFLILIPLIFSPVTLALSYFLVYGGHVPTAILIILIFTVILIPLNIRMLTQAVDTIPNSETGSSRTLGDSPLSSFFRIQLPRVKWEITTILSLMFITVMGEFSSIVTVYSPSTETITVGIYSLLLLRDLKDTYGLTEIFLIVIFISSYIINRMGKSGSVGQA